MKQLVNYTILILTSLLTLLSCHPDKESSTEEVANTEQNDNIEDLTIDDVKNEIPESFEIFKIVPLRLDQDKQSEFIVIVRTIPGIKLEKGEYYDFYLLLYNYENGWVKKDSLNTKTYFDIENYSVTDIDSNNIDEIHFRHNYMYANGETEEEIIILTSVDYKFHNLCKYIAPCYSVNYNNQTSTIRTIDWLEGDDLNGDGYGDDTGFWNCHHISFTEYEIKDGLYYPTKELKTRKKYSFDNPKYATCEPYSYDKILLELNIKQ